MWGWRAGSGERDKQEWCIWARNLGNVDESWGGGGVGLVKTQSREPSKRWSLKSLLYHHRRYGAID